MAGKVQKALGHSPQNLFLLELFSPLSLIAPCLIKTF